MPWWIGALIAAMGAALVAAALGAFRRAGEDPLPWTPNQHMIATGLYARSRNPMYLGMATVMLGVALAIGSAVAILLVPVAIAVIGATVIAREEAYLERKFGDGYRAYMTRVRRWL